MKVEQAEGESDATPVDQGEWMESREEYWAATRGRAARKRLKAASKDCSLEFMCRNIREKKREKQSPAVRAGHSWTTSSCASILQPNGHLWKHAPTHDGERHLWPHPKLTKVCWYWSVRFSALSFTIAAISSLKTPNPGLSGVPVAR